MTTKTRKSPSRTPYSPLAINMLLHFYAVCTPYLSRPVDDWPPAQREILQHYLDHNLVEPCDYGFTVTEKGAWLARQVRADFERSLRMLELREIVAKARGGA